MTELSANPPEVSSADGYQQSRQSKPLQTLIRWIGVLTVLLAITPILVIAASWGSDQSDVWQHLIETQLFSLLRNTIVLVLGVTFGVVTLGVSLAWLTVMCEFPGRRFFDWALMLPLAMPAYVLAFVVLGVFDFGGPIQGLLQGIIGEDYRYVDVRSEGTVIVVLALVFYPYVYMLARSAFLSQSSDVIEAARVLGASRWEVFFQVALPMARPAIIAGASLAIMETLADFGAVAVFNYDTFTTAIYKSWFGLFNIQAAAQLASLLLLFVALALFAEKSARGNRRYTQSGKKLHRFRHPLIGLRGYLASAYAWLVLLIAFLLPVIVLLQWVWQEGFAAVDARYFGLLSRTLLLGAIAAVLTIVMALMVAFGRQQTRGGLRSFYDLGTLGYAMPGSVLAVGIMLSFAFIDRNLLVPLYDWMAIETKHLLVGSVLGLLAAYWVRFLAVAHGPVDASLQSIKHTIPEAARSLGASSWDTFWHVYLPMLRPGLLTALVLVFVDVMKEMPATLLLRPFGWDTLAIRVYEMTSEGEWQRAALPALTLVLIGLLPVIQALRQSAR